MHCSPDNESQGERLKALSTFKPFGVEVAANDAFKSGTIKEEESGGKGNSTDQACLYTLHGTAVRS